MKKVVFLFVALICFFLSGCNKEHLKDPIMLDASYGLAPQNSQQASEIMVSVSDAGHGVMGQIVFTGNDILWYNETTKELRFEDNISKKSTIINKKEISFYMSNEYLFSSMIYTSDDHFQIINSLVLYYNMIENKYFLMDGYPDIVILQEQNAAFQQNMEYIEYQQVATDHIYSDIPQNGLDDINAMLQYTQELRVENMQKIASEWEKFIDQLKKEGRYIK